MHSLAVVSKVLLSLLILVGPVDLDLGVVDLAPIENLDGSLGCLEVIVLNLVQRHWGGCQFIHVLNGGSSQDAHETVIETTVLEVPIRNDFDTENWTSR